jgi:uncharacterized protein with HEPN domain
MKAGYPHIPWREIAGVGNILRHNYDRIDDHILWEIATIRFAELKGAVVRMRAELDETG